MALASGERHRLYNAERPLPVCGQKSSEAWKEEQNQTTGKFGPKKGQRKIFVFFASIKTAFMCRRRFLKTLVTPSVLQTRLKISKYFCPPDIKIFQDILAGRQAGLGGGGLRWDFLFKKHLQQIVLF